MGNRSEAIRHILATVFSAQNALRGLAPEYRWTGLGNLLGDYGEFVAIDHYGLTKAGASGFDATTPDGRTVQIKANHASQTIGIRGEADLLLVVRVEADGSWEELFYGDFQAALSLASWSSRDSKHSISVKALTSLGQRIQAAMGRDSGQETL
ncbi:MAG: hypothetical protein FJ054_02170 [Cyanobacteria bacterium M_surface_10_m2_119]|nr:hypothetical protein [Cyanobacteria bacterium M_surface_10_m2_119]